MLARGPERLNTYGYRFIEMPADVPVQLHSVGWETRTDTGYSWDGHTRKDTGLCLFQYTISGSGRLRLEDKEYTVRPGEAFLVGIPGDHHYYFSEADTHWEFIFVLFYGKLADTLWNELQSSWGQIVRLDSNDPVMKCLKQIYYEAESHAISDAFAASSLVYGFLMECLRSARGASRGAADAVPDPVGIAMRFAEANFEQNIGLEALAEAGGLSKYHFARLFRKSAGMTPAQYITKIRIEQAVRLLNRTEQSVEQIGRSVGFSNGNYFCKVFRKMIGTSPEKFRSGKDIYSVNEWTIR